MKLKNIFGICISTITLFCGCSDDIDLKNQENESGQVVRIAANMESDESRLAITELADKLDITWSTGDVLKVINPAAGKTFTNFTLSSGSMTNSGEFVGTPATPYQDGDDLYVLYHNDMVETDFDDDGNVTIVLKEQDGTKDQDYFLMYGKTTYDAEKGLQAVFMKHLVSILKLSITTDKTLNKITFDGAHSFRSKGTLVLKNSPSNSDYTFKSGDLAYCYNDDNSDVDYSELTVSGTFQPVNGEVSVYYYLLPSEGYIPKNENGEEIYDWSDRPWISPQFSAVDSEGCEYVCKHYYDNKNVEQGTMYELKTSLFKLVEFSNEGSADGSSELPFQISNADQLYTFMLRCHNGESKGAKKYNELCYELTSDIVLDKRVFWRGFQFYGTFDGANHTISGVKENWFIDEVLDGAKIYNLKLNLQTSIEKTGRSYFGVLASRASGEGTKIINCHNIGNINVDFYNQFAGTLVGNLEWGARMVGCSNVGNLTLPGADAVGGLVGRISSGATMEACYSTGNITLTGGVDWKTIIYVGGLAGSIGYEDSEEYKGKTKMTSCWENMVISVPENVTNVTTAPITAYGAEDIDYINCYKFTTSPDAEKIKAMNAAMTNGIYGFDTNGNIVEKFASNSTGKDFKDGGDF